MPDNYLAILANDTPPSTPTAAALCAPGTSMTLEMWVLLNPAGGSLFLAGCANATNTMGWNIATSGASLVRMTYYDGTALRNGPLGTVSPLDRLWHHHAYVKSGLLLTTYIDGVLHAQGTMVGVATVTPSTQPWGLGRAGHTSSPIGGLFSEVRFWNTARTQAQVVALMNARAVGTESGLAVLWPLNEGTGTQVLDKVGGLPLALSTGVWATTIAAGSGSGGSGTGGDTGTPTLVAQTDTTGRAVWRQAAAWYVCTVTTYGTAQPSVFLAASHWLPALGHGLCLGAGDAVRATVALQYGKQEVRPATGTAAALELNVAPDVACHIEAWQLV